MPDPILTYKLECGTTAKTGDRIYDYYSMKPCTIGRGSNGDEWFDTHYDDGKLGLMNGPRCCSLAFAARRGFPNAK